MTIQEYTLSDLNSKLNQVSNVSLFLATGDCPDGITSDLHHHLHEQIEELQHMLSWMRHYPDIKAKEAQSK